MKLYDIAYDPIEIVSGGRSAWPILLLVVAVAAAAAPAAAAARSQAPRTRHKAGNRAPPEQTDEE